MTTPDENPITRTSPQRMTKGILIVAITLAVGGAIIIPYWQTMIHNAPAASTIKHEPPETETGTCLLYTSPSPRDRQKSRMPSSA